MAESKKLSLKEKLMKIQVEIKAPKNLYNSFGNYKYRNVEGIQEALKPLEKAYGVMVTLTDKIEAIEGRVYVKATATIADLDSDASISVDAYAREQLSKKGADEAQITGASSSYARKYALNGLLLLDDTKDVDSEAYQKASQMGPEKKAASKNDEKAPDYRSMLRELIHDFNLDSRQIAEHCGLSKESNNADWERAFEYAKGLIEV